MRSLSLRIFLALWLAMLLIVLAAAGIIAWNAAAREDAARRLPNQMLQAATAALESGGRNGLRAWLEQQTQRPRSPRIYVIDGSGSDLLGRPLPPPLRAWLSGVPRDMPRRFGRVEYRPPRPLPILVGTDRSEYQLLILPPRRPFAALAPRAEARLAWFAAAVLITAIVSLLLSRSITRPIDDLRRVSEALAQGDLTAGPGPRSLGRRDALGALAASFAHMAERIRELLGARERLLRDVSHELRSPLTRMRLAIGIARQPGADLQTQLARVEKEAERMDELVDRVLALSRLGSSSEPGLAFETVQLSSLLREIVRDAGLEAGARTQSLHFDDDAATDLEVRADPQWLASAIDNVLRNAIRHAPVGSRIDLALQRSDAMARITISDQGPGVPEQELQKIFEPFHRVAGARERSSGGEGIGLAITARVVATHGGTVSAANASEGSGLIVTIMLPAGSP
ncbi:MAG: ATP-binding protein [Steroidobacteraceae bacterium]